MNKKWIYASLVIVVIAFGWSFWNSKQRTPEPSEQAAIKATTYWTCPMHPQIHSEHPGECPICHMKLVQVKAEGSGSEHQKTESRSAVQANPYQLELLGVQKTQVEKMDLTARIPIAGRFISSSTVAFQVYESDLKYVRPGLSFTGESTFLPEAEISGAITSVDGIVDPTSRTVRVLGSVKSAGKRIIPDTTFSGNILISLKNVIAIPESSVLHTGNGDIVYLVHEGGHLVAQNVRLGLKTEGYFEVVDGLESEQSISSGPNFLIDSEAKIRGAGNSNGHTNH